MIQKKILTFTFLGLFGTSNVVGLYASEESEHEHAGAEEKHHESEHEHAGAEEKHHEAEEKNEEKEEPKDDGKVVMIRGINKDNQQKGITVINANPIEQPDQNGG